MRRPETLRTCAAVLLALPLLGSAANFALQFAAPPSGAEYLGAEVWRLMREGGLLLWVAVAHGVTGVALIVRRTRYVGALVQLPITLGIVAFNATLFPPGLPLAIAMLLLNAFVLADRERVQRLRVAIAA